MISKETARKIYQCYQQIENCENLINQLDEILKKNNGELDIMDRWGEPRGLELAIPSGDSSSRIVGVPNVVAFDVINATIIRQKQRLMELKTIAQIELSAK